METMRPVYAAQALFDAAVDRVGLTNEDRVDPAIQKLAKAQGIPFKKTKYFVYLKNAKKTMQQLAQAPVDDGVCLAQTLDRLQVDVQLLVVRANAWAEGDVVRLLSLPFNDQKKACIAAMADNDAARAEGLADPEGAARERWLRITRESLVAHNVVFAQVPMWRLEGANGVLAALQADGYRIKSPE
ncbi:MAG: TraB/GumN family protein [Xanthomonadales bacterium]|nr:TraB/GumN family protein [Xanthomonadales bacterium]